MSTEVFDRAKTREVLIWGVPKIDMLIAMGAKIGLPLLTFIIPLEEDRFLQDFYLIQEHETIKYDQMIAWLVAELAKINAERTITIANIATKRIEKNLAFEARDRKLDNKIFSNVVAAALMDAQFDTLREDQAKLVTKQQQVTTAWLKANAEIAEIQSKIQLEAGNLLLAEIDVLKAQQDLAKKDIEILNAEIRVLQVAIDILEISIQITNLALEKVNIEADIKMLTVDILRTGLSAKHYTAEQKEIVVELDGITRRLASDLALIQAREAIVSVEISDTSIYLGLLSSLLVAQLAAEQVRGTIAAADEANAIANANSRTSAISTPEASSRIADANMKSGVSQSIASQDATVNWARRLANMSINNAQMTAAITRAKASVVSTLSHQIGSVK